MDKVRHNRAFRRGESVTSILINSYQPTIITETRRKIEDLCRDLVVNNDHVHCVEQRMRVAIEQVQCRGRDWHTAVSLFVLNVVVCLPNFMDNSMRKTISGRCGVLYSTNRR